MILILQVISPQPNSLAASRQVFDHEGGSIGREEGNSWVLPHSKVSGRHALIEFRDSNFYIEDTSRNGVFLNSSKNRLVRGQPYPLTSGDRILIDPYEIRVSIADQQSDAARRPAEPFGERTPRRQVAASDPIDLDDPFAPPASSPAVHPSADSMTRKELDPLELLNLVPRQQTPVRKAPTARDLELGSPLDAHFQPPAVVPAPVPAPPAEPMTIPEGYDPLAPEEPAPVNVSAAPTPRERWERAPDADEPPPLPRRPVPAAPRPEIVPAAARREPVAAKSEPASAKSDAAPISDLAAVLEGAGLDPADLTPELARTFGQILRIVVSGVMDVMRSRQQIKDEFRMRMTRFKTAENNPLKFSANVDDALHNLLVKRNPAYLPPSEAFEDAFADLRNHQLAMLAGLRTAFESMLNEFDPDRLQQEFDRLLSKGLVPAKLRYWDLYREKHQDIIKDPEASFRRLFGEEFARAYEEQLKQLKAKGPTGQ